MIYEILSVEDKSADWKVMTVCPPVEGGEVTEKVSVNRKNKDETIAFSNFDLFKAGYSFEGSDIWRNQKGNAYIFPPKPKAAAKKPWSGGAGKSTAVTAAMDRKEQSIEKFQDNKEHSIRLAGAMRDATQISLFALKDQPFTSDEEFKAEWTKWCKWLMAQGDQPFI